MIAAQFIRGTRVALLACAALAGAAHAEGLQVAPVSVTIPQRSGVVWLNNGSDQPLRAQVRVFRWLQSDGEDELVETDELIASPPFVEIAPDGQQVIRLVRFGDAALQMSECERTYRIIVDELPSTSERQAEGLRYVLRYSVPVYLTNPACENPAPQLSWQIVMDGEVAWLNVVNLGQMRAQLAGVSFIDPSGERIAISDGLLGYVLSGGERRFALARPASDFADGGQIEVSINGSQVREPVVLAASSQ